jgi:hypothetical protein
MKRFNRAVLAILSPLLVVVVPMVCAWGLARAGEEGEPKVTTQATMLDGKTAAERCAALVRYVASCEPDPRKALYPKASAPIYCARLLLDIDAPDALQKLHDSAAERLRMAKAGGRALDPFDKIALVHTYFLCKEKIPAETAGLIRDYVGCYGHKVWKGYGAMNYRLMEDGAGFLAAEEWPQIVDADGLDAAHIKAATRERLMGYFDGICRKNFAEYGAPIYTAVDLSAIRMLAEFAKDPELRKHATLTLDAMMVDLACTWNQGYNTGSASRAKYWGSTNTGPLQMESTATIAWLWFGAPRPINAASTGWGASFWMAPSGTYSVPDLIAGIASERSSPSVFRGSIPSQPEQIHRITYHSLHYSLASQFDHAASSTDALYKEGRRMMLRWFVDEPSSTFCVCMDNPRRPYALQEHVANAIGYGENPFSQYLQCEQTMEGAYSVPASYPYYKMYVPFPRSGSIAKRIEKEGWIFCHNRVMLMAFHSAAPCAWADKPWEGNDMLWCNARTNVWVLETAELADYAGGGVDAELNRFADAVLHKAKIETAALTDGAPHIVYRSLTNHMLDLTWITHKTPDAEQQIDGKPVDYASWKLFDSPWVQQELNSPLLRLRLGSRELTYDFARWTVIANQS